MEGTAWTEVLKWQENGEEERLREGCGPQSEGRWAEVQLEVGRTRHLGRTDKFFAGMFMILYLHWEPINGSPNFGDALLCCVKPHFGSFQLKNKNIRTPSHRDQAKRCLCPKQQPH